MKHKRTFTMSAALALAFASLTSMALVAGCGGDDLSSTAGASAVEGELELVMVGDGVTSHPEYFLSTAARGDRWLRLTFDDATLAGFHPTADGDAHYHVIGGVQVRATGSYLDGDTLHVSELVRLAGGADPEGAGVASTQGALIAPTPKKVAVLLVNFTSNPAQPVTADAARSLVFGATTSTNAYYKEQSFGARSLVGIQRADGDVFGWYTISNATTTCDYAAWGTAARAAAQAAGVSLTGYDHIIHYFPRTSTCAWSGVGQLPGKYSWINGSSSSTMAHELGHNFGVHHASSLSCTDAAGARVSISATCTSDEYGDPYDVMGRGYRHMSAYQKGRLGFLESTNTTTVAASGVFTVVPLETKPAAGATQSLRVAIPNTSPPLFYYVEFRQPSAFDNFTSTSPVLKGVLVHRAPDYTVLQRTQLLDMTAGTTSYTDAPLAAGATFTDATAGITIRVASVAATGATVQVTK